MTNAYKTPEAFKAALEQRLRNETAGTGIPLARRRQMLVFDRFLARLSHVLGDAVMLKGGLVLEMRLGRARSTKDVDLRCTGSPEAVLENLRKAGRSDLGDHLTFEVMPDKQHPAITQEGMVYDGKRFRVEARLAGKIYGSRFGVDVGFADPIFGQPDVITGDKLLAFAGVEPARIRLYPVETHLAEKLHAYTLPRKRTNTRVKDLPDLVLLGTIRELDATRVRQAIQQCFDFRATHSVPRVLTTPPDSWAPVYARMAREDELTWPTLADLIVAANEFLGPVLGGDNITLWLPSKWRWKA